MNQPGDVAFEPTIVGTADVGLVEDAARDLEPLGDEIRRPGHWPSWEAPEVPDGLALCVACWRLITASQLGTEPCPRLGRTDRPVIAAVYAGQITR